jgi:hypothetical protein
MCGENRLIWEKVHAKPQSRKEDNDPNLCGLAAWREEVITPSR